MFVCVCFVWTQVNDIFIYEKKVRGSERRVSARVVASIHIICMYTCDCHWNIPESQHSLNINICYTLYTSNHWIANFDHLSPIISCFRHVCDDWAEKSVKSYIFTFDRKQELFKYIRTHYYYYYVDDSMHFYVQTRQTLNARLSYFRFNNKKTNV